MKWISTIQFTEAPLDKKSDQEDTSGNDPICLVLCHMLRQKGGSFICWKGQRPTPQSSSLAALPRFGGTNPLINSATPAAPRSSPRVLAWVDKMS